MLIAALTAINLQPYLTHHCSNVSNGALQITWRWWLTVCRCFWTTGPAWFPWFDWYTRWRWSSGRPWPEGWAGCYRHTGFHRGYRTTGHYWISRSPGHQWPDWLHRTSRTTWTRRLTGTPRYLHRMWFYIYANNPDVSDNYFYFIHLLWISYKVHTYKQTVNKECMSVYRFLMAHQHMKGHLVPYSGYKQN